jgi:hypothetical protein
MGEDRAAMEKKADEKVDAEIVRQFLEIARQGMKRCAKQELQGERVTSDLLNLRLRGSHGGCER